MLFRVKVCELKDIDLFYAFAYMYTPVDKGLWGTLLNITTDIALF